MVEKKNELLLLKWDKKKKKIFLLHTFLHSNPQEVEHHYKKEVMNLRKGILSC